MGLLSRWFLCSFCSIDSGRVVGGGLFGVFVIVAIVVIVYIVGVVARGVASGSVVRVLGRHGSSCGSSL